MKGITKKKKIEYKRKKVIYECFGGLYKITFPYLTFLFYYFV